MTTRKKILIQNLLKRLKQPQLPPSRYQASAYAYDYSELSNKLCFQSWRTPREFLLKLDKDFHTELLKFERTSAAPSIEINNALRDTQYFVQTETVNEFNDRLLADDILFSNIVLIGPKGSGKTTFQNHWIEKNRSVLEQRKTLSLCCDATYLYDFWNESLAGNFPLSPTPLSDSLPTIDDYFNFLLLTSIANSRPGRIERLIFDQLASEGVVFPFKEDRAVESTNRVPKSISWYLSNHVKQRVEGDDDYIKHLFLEKPTRRREYFRWRDCANQMKKWMRESDYLLLKFLDGVDNLHLNTDEGTSLYDAFLPELRNHVQRIPLSNEVNVTVMRNRTYIDIMKRDPVTLSAEKNVNPECIYHSPPNTKDIIEKRIAWLRNNPSSEECANTIEASIGVLPNNDIIHDNIRTLIGSTVSLAAHVRFRYKQLAGQADLKHQATVQINRNLFLNGRFHLATQREFIRMNREKGLPFINPFWFDDDLSLNKEKDPLLLRIRMLELLMNGDMREESLIEYLVDKFRYDRPDVEQTLKDARAFGWIDSKSEKKGTSHITYEISPAGDFLLNELLSDIDVLYMLALDTRLPRVFFDEGLIQVHSNHIYHRSGYIGAAVITAIAFIRYLADVIDNDLKTINKDKQYTQFFLSSKAISKLEIHFDKILESASNEDWDLIISKYKNLEV
jgi:hypothetical protein